MYAQAFTAAYCDVSWTLQPGKVVSGTSHQQRTKAAKRLDVLWQLLYSLNSLISGLNDHLERC